MKHARSYEAYEGCFLLRPPVKSRPLILLTIRRTRRLNRRDLLVTKPLPLEIPLEIPLSPRLQSPESDTRRMETCCNRRERIRCWHPERNGGNYGKKRGLCEIMRYFSAGSLFNIPSLEAGED